MENKINETYDVVIIGAGNGGIMASALLASKGVKVLLLEQHNLPGGFASSFVRGRFEFETALHVLADYGTAEKKGAIRKIFEDQLDLDVEFVELPEFYRLILTDPDEKLDIVMPFGLENFQFPIDTIQPQIDWALKTVNADNLINRSTHTISGGEKQRVCIARALAAKPDLIICDEPTSALDQLVAEGILKLLQVLQNELSVSYLFITHDLATVKAISDEMVVMLKGRIVEQGVKEKVLAPPHHEYTELLLSSVPEMDPDWLDNVLEERKRKGIVMQEFVQD